MVLATQRCDGKNNVLTVPHVAYPLKKGKRLQIKQNNLLIEGVKYGLSLCLFVRKKIMRGRPFVSRQKFSRYLHSKKQ